MTGTKEVAVDLSQAERILRKMSADRDAATGDGAVGSATAGDDLIPLLQEIQDAYGYLPYPVLSWVSEQTAIPMSRMYGVITFYAQFRFTPPGRHHIKVCLGTACHVQGGEQMLDVLERRLEVRPVENTADGEYDLERVACLGCCALAPVVTVDDKAYGQMSVLKLQRLLDERQNAG